MSGECEHKYRRDVESCPYCELNEAEAEVRRLRPVLEKCRSAIELAIYSEDGLDGLDGERLLGEIAIALKESPG